MKKGLAILFAAAAITACNNTDKKTASATGDSTTTVAKDTPKTADVVVAQKPAIINIVDTAGVKRIIIYMKDSATTFDRIALKLGTIYGVKLADVLKKNGIKPTGQPMAWYKSQQAPYFFEAGVAVAKKPTKLPANVFVKEITADSVMIAHFYGPYDLLSQGYDAIKERMKDEKKMANGMPYEIYVGDPFDATGKPIDPYKVRTDIVFPRK